MNINQTYTMKKVIAVISIALFTFAIGCESIVNSDPEPIWYDTDEMKPIIDKPDTSPNYPE